MNISIKTVKGKRITFEGEVSKSFHLKIKGPIRELVMRVGPSLDKPSLDEETMCIFVNTLSGRTDIVEVKGSDTIAEVKAKLRETYGIQVEHQRLIFQGIQLEDNHTISENNIMHDATLTLMSTLCLECNKD